jgi:hypothetical protein
MARVKAHGDRYGTRTPRVLPRKLTRGVSAIELPIPLPLALNLRIDGRVLAFCILASAVAGLAAGIVPALRASGTELTSAMQGAAARTRVGRIRWSMRDTLVAALIAVTAVLVVTAGLLGRSLMAMQRADVGFRTDGIAPSPPTRRCCGTTTGARVACSIRQSSASARSRASSP